MLAPFGPAMFAVGQAPNFLHRIVEFVTVCDLVDGPEAGHLVNEDYFLRQAADERITDLGSSARTCEVRRRWNWVPAVKDTKRRTRRRYRQEHFNLSEFAHLDDGRRLLIRNDRGWTNSSRQAGPGKLQLDRQQIESYARTVLRDDENAYSAPWLCARIRRLYDINIDPPSVTQAWKSSLVIEIGVKLEIELRSQTDSAP